MHWIDRITNSFPWVYCLCCRSLSPCVCICHFFPVVYLCHGKFATFAQNKHLKWHARIHIHTDKHIIHTTEMSLFLFAQETWQVIVDKQGGDKSIEIHQCSNAHQSSESWNMFLTSRLCNCEPIAYKHKKWDLILKCTLPEIHSLRQIMPKQYSSMNISNIMVAFIKSNRQTGHGFRFDTALACLFGFWGCFFASSGFLFLLVVSFCPYHGAIVCQQPTKASYVAIVSVNYYLRSLIMSKCLLFSIDYYSFHCLLYAHQSYRSQSIGLDSWRNSKTPHPCTYFATCKRTLVSGRRPYFSQLRI